MRIQFLETKELLIKERKAMKKLAEQVPVIQQVPHVQEVSGVQEVSAVQKVPAVQEAPVVDQELVNKLTSENEKLKVCSRNSRIFFLFF